MLTYGLGDDGVSMKGTQPLSLGISQFSLPWVHRCVHQHHARSLMPTPVTGWGPVRRLASLDPPATQNWSGSDGETPR